MPVAPTPLAFASSANCCFQASKPPGALAHCHAALAHCTAAVALAPSDVKIASAAKVAVANCLPLVIQNSLSRAGAIGSACYPFATRDPTRNHHAVTASPNLHN